MRRAFPYALPDLVRIATFLLDVVPARVSDAANSAYYKIEITRNTVERELASLTQLIIVGLHALHQATLTTRDVAAEIPHVRSASAFYHLDCCGNSLPKIGLSQRTRIGLCGCVRVCQPRCYKRSCSETLLRSFAIFPVLS